MKIKNFLFFCALIISINSFGKDFNEKQYYSIERIEKGPYAIPLIKSSEYPDIADKINQVIQLTTIQKSYQVVGDKLFDGMINEDGFSGTTSLDYRILLNSEALLSIQFNDETVTTYPDFHTFYLNFNSATGDLIDLHELLGRAGVDRLNDLASSKFNKAIANYHEEIIQDSSVDFEQRKAGLDAVFRLTECNAKYEVWKFGITEHSFIVEKDRCFPHAMQAWDIGWACEILIDDLYSNDFTPYGRRLIKEKKSDKSQNFDRKEETMALRGKIDNKYLFCMFLNINSDNSIGGLYWYTKYGDLVDFEGKKISRNKIILTEKGGEFHLEINDEGNITGTWFNSGGKSFPIVFN